MKKLSITIFILFGLCMTTFADPNGGGLFQRGFESDEEYYGSGFRSNEKPLLPYHELNSNQPADTPLGSGVAVLLGFGAAYLVAKKRKE